MPLHTALRPILSALPAAASLALAGCMPFGFLSPGGLTSNVPDGFKGNVTVTITGAPAGVTVPGTGGWDEPVFSYAAKDSTFAAVLVATGKDDLPYSLTLALHGELAAKKTYTISTKSTPGAGEGTVAVSAPSTDGKSSTTVMVNSGTVTIDAVDGMLARWADRAIVTFSMKDATAEITTVSAGTVATGSVTMSLEGKAAGTRVSY